MKENVRAEWVLPAVSVVGAAASAQNHVPNPHVTIVGWARMTEGRT